MTVSITIDPCLLRRVHENFWIEQADTSFGMGLDGREQIVVSENRYWTGRLEFGRLPREALRQATVIGDRLRGRVGILRIPLCNNWTLRSLGDMDRFYSDAGVPADFVALGCIPFADGSLYSDGTGFSLPDAAEPTVREAGVEGVTTIFLEGIWAELGTCCVLLDQ